MTGTVVIGAQWGDEGKGKILDFMSHDIDYVVRYQGGANAGHSLKVSGNKVVTRLLPAGIINKQATCVLADGVVVDLDLLKKEMEYVKNLGYEIGPDRLKISLRAHITLPSHIKIDKFLEIKRDTEKIGTTKMGVGPTYEDKVARRGIRLADILDKENLKRKLELILDDRNYYIKYYLEEKEEDFDNIYNYLLEHAKWIQAYLDDTSLLIHNALKADKKVLFEGAQGIMLDIDAGTYPFVTSSNTLPVYAAVGSGISHKLLSNVVAVVKSYTTRVGEGPFPTEDGGDLGELMRFQGGEYGATTGQPRRCGWLDLVALKHAFRRSLPDYFVLTKLDVFSGFPEVKVAIAYEIDGKRVENFPADANLLNRAKPIYKTFKAWNQDLSRFTSREQLPLEAQELVSWLEKELETRLLFVSVGPDRKETINIDTRV